MTIGYGQWVSVADSRQSTLIVSWMHACQSLCLSSQAAFNAFRGAAVAIMIAYGACQGRVWGSKNKMLVDQAEQQLAEQFAAEYPDDTARMALEISEDESGTIPPG